MADWRTIPIAETDPQAPQAQAVPRRRSTDLVDWRSLPVAGDTSIAEDAARMGLAQTYGMPGEERPRAPTREALSQLRIDPTWGEAAGGMAGGAMVAPLAAATAPSIAAPIAIEAAGVGYGAMLGRKAAELWNEHVVGEQDPRSGLQRAADSSLTFGVNAATVPAGATLGKVASDAWQGVQQGVRRFFGGGTEESAAALKAFRDAGVKPTLGGVGGNEAKGVEQGLTKLPGGAGFMEKQLDRVRRDLTASFGKAQEAFGEPVTEMATAGGRAQGAARNWVSGKKLTLEDTYKSIRGLNKVQVDMDGPQTVAKEIIAEAQQGLGDAATLRVANRMLTRADGSLRGPGIDFGEGVRLRSDLLDLAHSSDAEVAGAAQAAAKRLSGALDQAMQEGATKAANRRELTPSEFTKWRAANQEWAKFRDDLETVSQVARAPTSEQAFKAVMNGAADGPSRLKVLKEALPQDAWDSVVSYQLGQMPLEKAGRGAGVERQFSPDQFLTNWRAIKSEESKTLLFGPKGDPRRDALDTLAEAVSRLKGTNVMGNPSGTAGQTKYMDWLSGGSIAGGVTLIGTGHPLLGGLSLAAGIGAPAASRGVAKLVESERFLTWLAQGARYKPADYGGMSMHLSRLPAIVKAEPELRDAMQQYIDGVQLLTPGQKAQMKPEERRK